VLVGVPWDEDRTGGEPRHWWRRLGWPRLAAFGVLLGLATHVRPVALLTLPFLALLWLRGAGWRVAGHRLAVVAVAVVAVLAPWTVRNAVVMEAFVPISTNTGDNLCMGRHPGASGGFSLTEHCFGGYDHLQRPEYEVRRNADATRKAIEHLRAHPLDEVRLVLWRAYYTFRHDHDGLDASESYGSDPFVEDRWRRVLEATADGWFFATIGLSLVGLPAFLRGADRRRPALVLAGVGVIVAPLVFFGDVRFHVPLLPFLGIGAGWTIVTVRRRLRAADGAGAPAAEAPV
jgi:hypothetical protein